MLQAPSLAPDVALAALLAEARRSAEEGISGGGMKNAILLNVNHESSYFCSPVFSTHDFSKIFYWKEINNLSCFELVSELGNSHCVTLLF